MIEKRHRMRLGVEMRLGKINFKKVTFLFRYRTPSRSTERLARRNNRKMKSCWAVIRGDSLRGEILCLPCSDGRAAIVLSCQELHENPGVQSHALVALRGRLSPPR